MSKEGTPPSITAISQSLAKLSHPSVCNQILVPLAREIQTGWESQTTISAFAAHVPQKKTRVINGTGILLHTNLGRAPLGEYVSRRVFDAARGFCNLEMNLNSGKRGARHSFIELLFRSLQPEYESLVVNNNAAALILVLKMLAKRSPENAVIVSRGELVEIGGGFRIPEILLETGVRLIEVGTTNKTYLRDYEAALAQNPTAVILKVHPSCFNISGFAESVDLQALSDLRLRFSDSTLLFDAGSLSAQGIRDLKPGCDFVLASGDKLLGGPQCGIIFCSPPSKTALSKEPFFRALRLDKLCIAALEACLELHVLKTDQSFLPISQMFSSTQAGLKQIFLEKLGSLDLKGFELQLIASEASVGGGSWNGEIIASCAVWVHAKAIDPGEVQEFLRHAPTPVIGYIRERKFLIDLRTVLESDWEDLARSLRWLDERIRARGEEKDAPPEV